MNKQIRDLAIVAGYGDRWNTTEEFEIFLARFAKFIVEDCAHFVEEDQGSGDVLACRMKQHFGVEE